MVTKKRLFDHGYLKYCGILMDLRSGNTDGQYEFEASHVRKVVVYDCARTDRKISMFQERSRVRIFLSGKSFSLECKLD
jgi:hypothetical protein